MGALKIEVRGTQNHRFTPAEFTERFQRSFGMSLPTAHTQERFARTMSVVS